MGFIKKVLILLAGFIMGSAFGFNIGKAVWSRVIHIKAEAIPPEKNDDFKKDIPIGQVASFKTKKEAIAALDKMKQIIDNQGQMTVRQFVDICKLKLNALPGDFYWRINTENYGWTDVSHFEILKFADKEWCLIPTASQKLPTL